VTRLARTARAEALGMPLPRLTVVLPVPPSLNHQYIHTRYGTRLTPAAEAFRQEAVLRARSALSGAQWPCSASYRLTVDVWFANRRRRDLDNTIKVLQDALAAALGFNDSQITELHIYGRGVDTTDPRCDVTLEVLP
jgi:crossover junction endodeoxyribonuclease RusA